jgi:hypothetical protein
MVERAAVNRDVVGSSPTSGAIFQVVEVQRQFQPVGGQNAQVCSKIGLVNTFPLLFRHFSPTIAYTWKSSGPLDCKNVSMKEKF